MPITIKRDGEEYLMPFVLRRSGKDFERNGQIVTPRAQIGFCETCGYEGAPFGFVDPAGNKTAWCGWRDGQAVCIGRGAVPPAVADDLFGRVA